MVLSNEEFNTAKICDIDTEKQLMSSLFQLRQSTHSFLIQCLADREIQKLIYSKPNYSSPKSAYNYNCKVIHHPHAWYHLNAVRGHGWNARNHQPLDPKLKIGHVHANQYLNKKQNNDNHLAATQQAKEQIRQYEETIRILQEENTKVKQLYLNALKDRNGNTGNVNTNNTASNSQQLNQLQQETRALKAVIESHKATIQTLKDQNISLQWKVNGLQTQSSSENTNNASNNQLIYKLQEEIRMTQLALQGKTETIRTLESKNLSLQARLRDVEMNSPSSSLPPRSSRTRDNGSQGCCIIM